MPGDSVGMRQRSAAEFFGLTRFPFCSTVLKDEYANLFLNREPEVAKLKAAVARGSNGAIVGAQGSGKSSLLWYLSESLKQDVHGKMIEFAFSFDTEATRRNYLCEILRSLLELLVEQEGLARNARIDVGWEVRRLGATVTLDRLYRTGTRRGTQVSGEIGADIGGSLLPSLLKLVGKVGGKYKQNRVDEESAGERVEFPIHDEASLTDSIRRICRTLPKPVVLYVDELDKAGREPLDAEDWDKEVEKVLELSRDLMLERKLTFVFTLQERLLERLDAAVVGTGDAALLGLIPNYVVLGTFDLGFAEDYVRNALEKAGWAKRVEAFCEPALLRLALALGGACPRRFANNLEQVTDLAALENVQPVPVELLVDAIRAPWERSEGLAEEHWKVLLAAAHSDTGIPTGGTPDPACRTLAKKGLLAKPKGSKRYTLAHLT